MTSDSKAPVTDEQRAREWLEASGWAYARSDTDLLAALLASRALEEAKWWANDDEEQGKILTKLERERIAALEQAAASRAAGGERK